jgi:zinc D-Ala-D-Ala carboxypeptidase
VNLSDHFTLEELTFSEIALRRGLDNAPNEEQISNLVTLCEDILEPARALLGAPGIITSGYRSKALNKIVGGAIDSVHPEGLAADTKWVGWKIEDAFDALRTSPKIIYDQIILECGAWVHISRPKPGVRARREMLRARGIPGSWVYERIG